MERKMTLGKEYGKALFMLTEEYGTTEGALEDVATVRRLLAEEPAYVRLLDTPAVPKSEKLGLIDEAFAAIDESVRSVIKMLCEKHSVFCFYEVEATYRALYDASRGIEHVEAVTAVAMSEEQLRRMAEKLAAETGKKILIKNTVAPEILGGVKLRYSGKQLDGSLKARIDRFEKSLKNTVI